MDPSYSLFAPDDTRIDKEFLPCFKNVKFSFSFEWNVNKTQHYFKNSPRVIHSRVFFAFNIFKENLTFIFLFLS